ncbi:MAG: [LysW]-aminoadipate kinase [Ardenticatenaceae bacterium]|nr:[LysW]-aminoadipate kinase [Ardenticatenaceae bacterium]
MLVVKVGGGAGNELDGALRDLAALWTAGERWVLVHGGSARTNEVAAALGHPPQFVTSESGFESRRTDRETLKIFEMVYCGEVNTGIVEELQARGVNALGLSGVDGRLLEGTRKKAIRVVQNGRRLVLRDDYTGTVETVNTALLRLLLEAGYAPVISPPAISGESEPINVDGDRAAAALAAALGAETLVLLTGAPGLMRRFPDPSTLIPRLPRAELASAIEQFAEGRMRLKLLAAQEALSGGVRRVILAGSAGERPVQAALEGRGTVIE